MRNAVEYGGPNSLHVWAQIQNSKIIVTDIFIPFFNFAASSSLNKKAPIGLLKVKHIGIFNYTVLCHSDNEILTLVPASATRLTLRGYCIRIRLR